MNIFFKVKVLGVVNFPLKWRAPRRTRIPANELSEDESNNVASLVHHYEREGLIDGNIVMDPMLMNRYFGDRMGSSQVSIPLQPAGGRTTQKAGVSTSQKADGSSADICSQIFSKFVSFFLYLLLQVLLFLKGKPAKWISPRRKTRKELRPKWISSWKWEISIY